VKIRFQADADLNQIILLATVRRESGIDFQTATAADLAHRHDREVLVIAAREGRILVTHDQKTMPRNFADFIMTETSPDMLVIPQHLSIVVAVEDLQLIWFATEAEEWINRIGYGGSVKVPVDSRENAWSRRLFQQLEAWAVELKEILVFLYIDRRNTRIWENDAPSEVPFSLTTRGKFYNFGGY
jgi:hypothetical protein